MIVNAYKTHKILPNENLFSILDSYLPDLKERSVVVLSSKVVGICEGRVVKIDSPEADTKLEQKSALAISEAQKYLPRDANKYNIMLTITKNIMVASAGIDESNSKGYFSLWPEDPQKSANTIREYLITKSKKKHLGVIITDSKLTPLRWGVTGISIAHSGFLALNSYIGKPDIFGELMKMEQSNVADALAVAAVVQMGEGAEQQPLAVITDVPFVQFQGRNPTQEELDSLQISLEEDVYSEMLTKVEWKKGKGH